MQPSIYIGEINMPKQPFDLTTLARQAMLEYNLAADFSQEVMNELSQITSPAPSMPAFRDLRDKLWASIDNDDSLDLDQLTYAEKASENKAKVYVAVADVDALVKRGSAIDQHAACNTTSVYTPSIVFPMLPEKLSTNLTSLNQGQERRAIVVELLINEKGATDNFDIYPAVVRNQAKLTYNGVAAWLDGTGPALAAFSPLPELAEQLRLQDALAKKIKQYRYSQGSLSFKTIEMQPIIRDGQVVNLEEVVHNRAHKLIEFFMISANTAVTQFIRKRNLPTLRRVVRSPKNWGRIVEIAESFGEKLSSNPDSKALEAFLVKRRRESPQTFPDLSQVLIKLLGRGEYVVGLPGEVPIGHFDLALQDYAHTTAPNRRYPDLIMQRILKHLLLAQPAPYSIPELTDIARHCTEKETDAAKVERKLKKSAAAILLSSQIGREYDAIVTGAGEKGVWVRILQLPVEGKLVKGFAKLKVGDRLPVKLIHVDIPNGYIDFERK